METTHSLRQRSRTSPLIPEPFENISTSRTTCSLSPVTKKPYMFWPELDIPRYRNRLSEEKQTGIDERARKLFRRAVQNQIFEASDYGWEADAWHDVFGLIRDDDTFRMLDKRPYEFVENDANGNKLVKRRKPDATMGLRTYNDLDLDHGYRINHDGIRPNKSLMGYRINEQMWDRERGLIVDGIWGDSNLIFPFAVYEAKKHISTLEQAKEQIYHAFRIYLAMLDDLARDPLDVTKYQSGESTCYQLFGFISCGSYWEVYLAYNRDGQRHVDAIWKGDVKDFNRARELICLVYQVHGFAANQHRKFVIKHLEPWLGQFEDPKPNRLVNNQSRSISSIKL